MSKQDRIRQIPLIIGLTFGLFASACSGEPQIGDNTAASPTTARATTSIVAQSTTLAPTDNETNDGGSTDADTGSVDTGDAPLLLALDTLGEARAFRMTVTAAQTIRSRGLGLNVNQRIDPARPVTMTETASNGDSYVYLDLGPLLSPMAAGNRSLVRVLDETHIEMWMTSEQIIIDATGYQGIADLDPAADLGPFAPGVGYIDLVQLDALAGKDLVAAIAGNSLPDPTTLAQTLPFALENIEQDPVNPNVYTATSSYAALMEARGQDIVAMTRSVAIPIAPTVGVSVDELAAFYQQAYEQILSDLVITVGSDGSLESIRDTTDLSSLFDFIVSEESGLDLSMTTQERDEFRLAFAGTVWILTTVTTFELDDSIVVTPPAGDLENRTQVSREYFAELIG